MKPPYLSHSVVVAAVSLLLSASSARCEWVNGQAASAVFGQNDFSSTDLSQATASKLHNPSDFAVDPTTNKAFVSDTENYRVLRFSSIEDLKNGVLPEAVLGSADFTTRDARIVATTVGFAYGIAVDSNGTLWVADGANNRVLRFDNASSKMDGASADGVLGQNDFTSNASGLSASRFYAPYGVAVDDSGTLWVADRFNNRVLRFDNAAGKDDGDAADGVLGQDNFTSGGSGLTAATMSGPRSIFVDGSGTLWVADGGNGRVLRFANAAAKANGANADGVLGKTGFTSSIAAGDQSAIGLPFGIMLDSSGDLWVADYNHRRVLRYADAAAKANGANADTVIGNANFTIGSTGSGPASTVHQAVGVFSSGSELYVMDSGHRILTFIQGSGGTQTGDTSSPTAAPNTALRMSLTKKLKKTKAKFKKAKKKGNKGKAKKLKKKIKKLKKRLKRL